MKKKILLAVIAAMLAVLLVFTFTACNTNETPTDPENPDGGDTATTVTETVTVDGVVYTPTDDGTAYTASAENQQISGEIVIQSPTEGVPVVAIKSGGFYECSSLTSVVIPDSVTTIGEYAFEGCTSLAISRRATPISACTAAAICCCIAISANIWNGAANRSRGQRCGTA